MHFNAIFLLFFSLLQLPMMQGQGNSNLSSCVDASTMGYANPSSCTLMEIQNGPLRVVFLDKQYVTQNQAAINSATAKGINYTFGSTCEHASTAVPEWYVIRFLSHSVR